MTIKEQVIKSIDSLAHLQENWDDEGALRISQVVRERAKKIIDKIGHLLSEMPCIYPCSDGTIDISFRSRYEGLINISTGTLPGAYYFQIGTEKIKDSINENLDNQGLEKLIEFLTKYQ